MIITHGNASQNLDKVTSFTLDGKVITFYETSPVVSEIRDGLKGKEYSYKSLGSMFFRYETEDQAKRAFNQINQLLNAVEV